MKRSSIDAAIIRALLLLESYNLQLPPFGYWTADKFHAMAPSLANLKKTMLGWDVTDFGSDDFERVGATLFTIRNGHPEDKTAGTPYSEKLIFLWDACEQEIPFHYHATKTEDIINRGGGVLMLQLYNSLPDNSLDECSEVRVRMDGIDCAFPAGSLVEVENGSSITLVPGLYHRFYAKKGYGGLIVGEVSSINDDRTDNFFLVNNPRFSQIEEDTPAKYRLCNE